MGRALIWSHLLVLRALKAKAQILDLEVSHIYDFKAVNDETASRFYFIRDINLTIVSNATN